MYEVGLEFGVYEGVWRGEKGLEKGEIVRKDEKE